MANNKSSTRSEQKMAAIRPELPGMPTHTALFLRSGEGGTEETPTAGWKERGRGLQSLDKLLRQWMGQRLARQAPAWTPGQEG